MDTAYMLNCAAFLLVLAPCCTDTLPIEKAAIHCMAVSMTQLTPCQVSSEEIQTATELLEKASYKLKSVAEVLPQQSLTSRIQRVNCATTSQSTLHFLSEL